MKTALKLFWYRLRIAYLVVFGGKSHIVLLRMSTDELRSFLDDGKCSLTLTYNYLHKYNAVRIIKAVACSIPFADEVEMKILYEAQLEEFLAKGKNECTPLSAHQ